MRKYLIFAVIVCVIASVVALIYSGDDKLEYWYDNGVEMTDGTVVQVLTTDNTNNMYVTYTEKSPRELDLPYSPQLDAYLGRLLGDLGTSATENMEDITLATSTGVYNGQVWYFLSDSYTDTFTKNKVINIMGVTEVSANKLLIMNFGMEDVAENFNKDIIKEFLKGYDINWKVDNILS